ncbi:MAG: hypothetical protein U0941_11585 [Planctomycetaceae bacterium]
MLRSWTVRFCAVCTLACAVPTTAMAADVFERHQARLVKSLVEDGEASKQLQMQEASKLKPLAATISSPCIVVRTDEGGYAKLLVAWGLKKGKSAEKPTPVLLIERYVTYRGDRLDLTSATGKDVMLFPGFGFNLDIGQVVPEGQGEDIVFTADGDLVPAANTKLVPLNGSQLPPAEKTTQKDPNAHEGVLAEDFTGTWKLNADGRWLGEMELKVTEGGRASGSFISDESKNSYEVSGQTGGTPHNLKLEVFLANTQLSVDGYLWTKDKSQMAGTVTMTGRKFGFVATRVKSE